MRYIFVAALAIPLMYTPSAHAEGSVSTVILSECNTAKIALRRVDQLLAKIQSKGFAKKDEADQQNDLIDILLTRDCMGIDLENLDVKEEVEIWSHQPLVEYKVRLQGHDAYIRAASAPVRLKNGTTVITHYVMLGMDGEKFNREQNEKMRKA